MDVLCVDYTGFNDMKITSFDILGVPAHSVDFGIAISAIEELFTDGSDRKYVVALNAEKIMMARRNPEIMQILKDAYLLIPDGVGVSLASRILYGQPVPRVPGYDLFLKLADMAAAKRLRVFLMGGYADVVNATRVELTKSYPGIHIAGVHHGYFGDDEPIIDLINKCKPDVLFVGMGSPRQEKWIHKNISRLGVKLCFGVGGSFDVITGRTKLAPASVRRLGFEFVYRLLVNPRRLRRQLVFPNFLASLLATRTKLMRSNKT
ncbi:MAG: WecB/TagA/CpsF family glycosyltransferase [candidate division WOR-3 bacterium]|nr:MAG: WecB/TagA/CpsF family glycosyltransferase [candidate division WOR-3 bacterium]